jgi:hypothetical protein
MQRTSAGFAAAARGLLGISGSVTVRQHLAGHRTGKVPKAALLTAAGTSSGGDSSLINAHVDGRNGCG